MLLYELLTGTTPFDKDRIRQASYDEMRRIIREEEPPKPSTRISTVGQAATTVSTNRKSDPKQLSRLFRGELDWIVMKTLEKDRNRRYETANSLAADVERYLHDEPVQACPPSPWYRVRKFASRHRLALAAAATVFAAVLVAVGGLAGSIGWIARDRAAREAALDSEVNHILEEAGAVIGASKWDDASAAVERAKKLLTAAGRREFPSQLQELNHDVTMAVRLEEICSHPKREDFSNRQEQDAEYAQAFQDYGIDLVVLSPADAAERIRARSIRIELAQALDIWSGVRRKAGTKGEPNWKHLLEVAKAADPDSSRNLMRDALQRRDRQALENLVASRDILKWPPGTLHLLAIGLDHAGSPEKAIALLRRAQRQHPDNMWINDELGWLCLTALRPPEYDDVVRFYTAFLALRPHNRYIMYLVGYALTQKGRFAEAADVYSKAIELNPNSAQGYSRRGSFHAELQQWDKAADDFAIATKLEPDEHWYWYQYAPLFLQLGNLDEYRRCCRAMIRRFGRTASPLIAHRVAWDCLLTPDAVGDLKPALRLAEHAVGQDPNSAWHLLILGAGYYRAGRLEPAVERLEQALKASERARPLNLPYFLASRWLFLALTYHGMGQSQQADHCLEQAIQGMDRDLPKPEKGALGEHWSDWIKCQIVRREAEAQLKGNTNREKRTTKGY